MQRIGPALPIFGMLLACSTFAGEKKIPVAEGSNGDVEIKATFVDQDQLKQMVGTDFGKMFTALELQGGGAPFRRGFGAARSRGGIRAR